MWPTIVPRYCVAKGPEPMTFVFLVFAFAVLNLALGYAVAVHLGRGPPTLSDAWRALNAAAPSRQAADTRDTAAGNVVEKPAPRQPAPRTAGALWPGAGDEAPEPAAAPKSIDLDTFGRLVAKSAASLTDFAAAIRRRNPSDRQRPRHGNPGRVPGAGRHVGGRGAGRRVRSVPGFVHYEGLGDAQAPQQMKAILGSCIGLVLYHPGRGAGVLAAFDTMLQCTLTRGTPYIKDGSQTSHEVSGIIGLSGESQGTVVVGLGRETALRVTEVILQERPPEINGDVVDAVDWRTSLPAAPSPNWSTWT
jgi:hypothetical protein